MKGTEAVSTHIGRRWRRIRVLGAGGMATVYEVEDPTGRRAAAKILHEGTLDGDRMRRLAKEADFLKSLCHPAIPELYDYGIDQGRPYVVMELLTGSSLDVELQRGGHHLHVDRVVDYACAALDALSVVHAAGVVHRDLKPSNLFVTDKGVLKILDFGIARFVQSDDNSHSATRGLLGTPAFMSPEQARGRWDMVDQRSDVWAVGAIMFTLSSGRHVHPAVTPNEQLAAAMAQSAPSLGSVAPWVDAAFAAVIDRALAYDRRERWQTAAEFRGALRNPDLYFRSDTNRGEATVRDSVTASKSGARSRIALSIVAALVVAGVIFRPASPERSPPAASSNRTASAPPIPPRTAAHSLIASQALVVDASPKKDTPQASRKPSTMTRAPATGPELKHEPTPVPDLLDERYPLLAPKLAKGREPDQLDQRK